ncbi:MAG: TrbC/VirB2 family protein [Succinivibrio sp.]
MLKVLNQRTVLTVVIFLIMCSLVNVAGAAESSSTVLPYEGWLKTLQKSIAGPVAYACAVIGIVACGITLIFTGGEIKGFVRSIVYLVLVMSLVLGANSIISSLFNGAVLSSEENAELMLLERQSLTKDYQLDIGESCKRISELKEDRSVYLNRNTLFEASFASQKVTV